MPVAVTTGSSVVGFRLGAVGGSPVHVVVTILNSFPSLLRPRFGLLLAFPRPSFQNGRAEVFHDELVLHQLRMFEGLAREHHASSASRRHARVLEFGKRILLCFPNLGRQYVTAILVMLEQDDLLLFAEL